jgi:endonuclease YncB( thermonuclease family)
MNSAGFAVAAIDSSQVDYAVGDADTVEIISKGFMGIGQRKLGSVRLSGIDAPETAHEGFGGPGEMPFAQRGKQYLSNVLSARSGATVTVGQGSTFGRSVGIVTDDSGINYSYEMVNQGLATVLYRNTAQEDLVSQKQFNAAERVARASNKGLFADPFYAGVHAGIGGRERKGYNVLSPANAYKFNFDRSPGTSKQQAIQASQIRNEEMSYPMDMSYNDYNEIFHSANSLSSNRKNGMADMQIMAMAGGLERNRGRRKERR